MNFTDSPYERLMKERPASEPEKSSLAPKGSPCYRCPYWRGIACVYCFRQGRSVEN